LSQGIRIIDSLVNAGARIEGGIVLELGTGWTPIIPALFWLLRPSRVICTDVECLMDAATIDHAKRLVTEHAAEVSETLFLPASLNLRTTLAGLQLDYRCPFDPRTVPDHSVDVVYSRAVFEHIERTTLASLLRDFHRMLRPGGLMCHVVDNSDHFEHRDKSLSRLNFLRYGPLAWRAMCLNRQNYQNRLRHSDYEHLITSVGFDLLASSGEPDEVAMRDLNILRLAPQFEGRPKVDLAILTSQFLARRP
jgi:SAM-dependent methyltransferase